MLIIQVSMVDPAGAGPAGTGPPVDGHGGADFGLLLQQLLGARGRDYAGRRGAGAEGAGTTGLATELPGEGLAADAVDLPSTSGGDLVALLVALLAAPGGLEFLASWAGKDVAGQLAVLVSRHGGEGEMLALALGRWLGTDPRLAAYLEQLAAGPGREAQGGVVPVTGAGGGATDVGNPALAAPGRPFKAPGGRLALMTQASPTVGAFLAGVSQGVASKGAGAQPGGTLAAGVPPGGPEAAAGQMVPRILFSPATTVITGRVNPEGQLPAAPDTVPVGMIATPAREAGQSTMPGTFVTATWSGTTGLHSGDQVGGGIRQAIPAERTGARIGKYGDLPLATGQLPGASPAPGSETAVVGLPRAMDFLFTWLVQKGQLIREGQRTVLELHLRPEALGKMRLEVISEGSQLLGHLLVESQAARQMVQSNLAQLQQDLNQQGLHFDQFWVDVAGSNVNWGGPAQQQASGESGEGLVAGHSGRGGGMMQEDESSPVEATVTTASLIDYLV